MKHSKFFDKIKSHKNRSSWHYSDVRYSQNNRELPHIQGMKRPYKEIRESHYRFHGNNDALDRYLHSKVGQDYNQVHSFMVNNVPGWFKHHLYSYLDYTVCTHTRETAITHYKFQYYWDFWVDEQGLLQIMPKTPKRKHTYPQIMREKDVGNIHFYLKNGLWYQYFVFKVKWKLLFVYDAEKDESVRSFVKSMLINDEPYKAYSEQYASNCTPNSVSWNVKQCNRATLKRNGLVNDPDFVPIVPKQYHL